MEMAQKELKSVHVQLSQNVVYSADPGDSFYLREAAFFTRNYDQTDFCVIVPHARALRE